LAFVATAHPAATPPPYLLPERREPIVLHEGPLELRHDNGTVVAADGRLELQLVPTLRFRFVIPDPPTMASFPGPSPLSVVDLDAVVPVFVTRASIGEGAEIVGTLDTSSVNPASDIVEVRFFVPNLPDFMGEALREAEGETGWSAWAGRIALAAGDWEVTLDERRDYREVFGRLQDEGGFEITHVGSLRRGDGTAFSDLDALNMLNTLAGFLGLVSGAWASPTAAIGLASDGTVIWREWNARWTSPWLTRLAAFDERKHDLAGAFAGYFERWSEPVWNEPLRIATQMYVDANGPIAADVTLVLGQTILELVAWVLLVEELGTRSARDFEGFYASDRLREVLGWIGIDAAIPGSLAALSREAAGRWDDGPHAITEMRNSLVHPNRRQRLTSTPVHARIELQELVIWYVELALLRLIDYQGGYMNRLGPKAKGVVDDVPWA
jgi:hypothetical protein